MAGAATAITVVGGVVALYFVLVDHEIICPPPNDPIDTVAEHYQLVSAGKFDEAWALFSSDYRSGRSFAAWKSGYADTASIQVEVNAPPVLCTNPLPGSLIGMT